MKTSYLNNKNRAFVFLLMIGAMMMNKATHAQNDSIDYKPFDGHVQIKNMHTWRGSVVTSGALFATSLEYKTRNDKFTLGLWGGAGFTGDYKEFSYYASYRFAPNFYIQAVSHNNFSGIENPDIFSYDKHTSPNFVDIALGYTISERVPLSIYWATILAGQAQDYEIDEDGELTDSYSNYVELKYRLYNKHGYKFSAFVGGAFSFSTDKTFYSEESNVVNAGVTLEKPVTVWKHNIPLEFTALWNPEVKTGVLQVAISLF